MPVLKPVKRRRGRLKPPPPSKKLVEYYKELLNNSVWCRSVRDTILKQTPYVNRRSIEIVTALPDAQTGRLSCDKG